MDCDAGDFIDIAQDIVQWQAYVRTLMNPQVPNKSVSYLYATWLQPCHERRAEVKGVRE